MAKQRILSIGFIFPGGEVDQHGFESDQSLLDADIVVFQTTLGSYFSFESYRGKPYLNESSSFKVTECLSHWRAELKDAFDAGKVIFVFLARPIEVFVQTGEKRFSGTGRNQKVTQVVVPRSSYEALPLTLDLKIRSGTEITPAGDLGFLAPYWDDFGEGSPYEVTLVGKFSNVLLRTKSGDAIVGAVVLGNRGAIVLLPPIHYDQEAFTEHDEQNDQDFWSDEAQAFGHRLAKSLSEMARALRARTEETPAPDWAGHEKYLLPTEEALHNEIRSCTEKIEEIRSRRTDLDNELKDAGRLRGLFYERGRALERAIIEALSAMGFSAAPFSDDDSDFDIVFSSGEGRFLGEAEGKDKRAINIDKLSQLERNLQEDFARDDIDEYAKGVLFGNPYRLIRPEERAEAFTPKCIAGAKRAGVALVRTPDLFEPARYLLTHDDPGFTDACRRAIAEATGEIVKFPIPPTRDEPKPAIADATGDAEESQQKLAAT